MRHFYLLIALLSATPMLSQNYVDIVNVAWDEGFQNGYGTDNIKGRFSEWSGDLTVPLVLSDKVAVLTGFTCEGIQLTFKDDVNQDIRVYGAGVKLGLNIRHNEKWSGTYLSIPKLSADELRFTTDNFQIGWIGLLKRTIHSSKNYTFGIYTNSELFGPFVVPIFGYYHKTQNWEVNILAPLAAKFDFLISDNIRTGVHFKGIIKSYQLNEQSGYLTKANNELSLASTLQLGKWVWMTNVGTTIGRRLRVYEDDSAMNFAISALRIGDHRIQQNQDLQDGLFVKTSLILRFTTL